MILLTGGAGFIGSCLLKYFNDKGIKDILVVDNFNTSDKWKNLVGKDYIEYFHKDYFMELLADESMNYTFSKDIKCIIHLGACSATTEKDMDYLHANNFLYSKSLLEFAKANDIKFIYASSAATYGLGENGYSDTEYKDLKPLNAYGFSKYVFDKFIIDNNLIENVIGLKFFNVFGPNEYHKDSMASMIYKAYNQIKAEGKVRLFKSNDENYADGGQMRDFIYVKDVVRVIYELMLSEKEISGIFNLGTAKARNWNDLATATFKAMDINPNIEYIDMPESLINQYQNFTEADMSKWEGTGINVNFESLEESIEDYVKNHLTKNWKNW